MLFTRVMALLVLTNFISAEEIQTVDHTELMKIITEKQYIVALFCPSNPPKYILCNTQPRRTTSCEVFEEKLISIGEDLLEVNDGDVRVVKLMDSPMVEEYAVENTDLPVIILFRNSLPVIYDGE